MNKFSYIILGIWIALAILDFISVFVKIPVVGFVFGALNAVIIFNLIPLFIQEAKAKKALKKAEAEAKETVVEQPKPKKRIKKTKED